jgi:RNA polymerase sigma-70 factor (ECF subfamily)
VVEGRDNETDATLIQLCKDGDQHAFRKIVERYNYQIRKTVYGMLGDDVVVDDVSQEVFIRFYNALASFRHESKLRTYLTRIAINLSINEIKKRKKRRLRESAINRRMENLADMSQDVERETTRQHVQKAIQMLEPGFRSVITLRMIDGYSVKETAEVLRLPLGTVASRLSRAQDKLKEIMLSMNLIS